MSSCEMAWISRRLGLRRRRGGSQGRLRALPIPVTSRFGAPIPVAKTAADQAFKSALGSAAPCRRGTGLEFRRRSKTSLARASRTMTSIGDDCGRPPRHVRGGRPSSATTKRGSDDGVRRRTTVAASSVVASLSVCSQRCRLFVPIRLRRRRRVRHDDGRGLTTATRGKRAHRSTTGENVGRMVARPKRARRCVRAASGNAGFISWTHWGCYRKARVEWIRSVRSERNVSAPTRTRRRRHELLRAEQGGRRPSLSALQCKKDSKRRRRRRSRSTSW